MEEIKTFALGDKMVSLIFTSFESEINVDDMLKIDYANIMGELLTFPVILNRLGVMLSEMEAEVKKAEFNISLAKDEFDEAKAKIEQEVKIELLKTIKSPTLSEISGGAMQRNDYKEAKTKYNTSIIKKIEIEKDKENLKSFYWSAKAKSDILTKMTDKLSPLEFEGEIIDSKINGILIKVRDKLIK